MVTKITITNDDGTTEDFFANPTPAPAPTDTEVDVLMSDGTTKTFVPKV